MLVRYRRFGIMMAPQGRNKRAVRRELYLNLPKSFPPQKIRITLLSIALLPVKKPQELQTLTVLRGKRWKKHVKKASR